MPTTRRITKWNVNMEDNWSSSSKVQCWFTLQPHQVICTIRGIPKRTEIYIHTKKMCTQMFIALLFIITPNRNNSSTCQIIFWWNICIIHEELCGVDTFYYMGAPWKHAKCQDCDTKCPSYNFIAKNCP